MTDLLKPIFEKTADDLDKVLYLSVSTLPLEIDTEGNVTHLVMSSLNFLVHKHVDILSALRAETRSTSHEYEFNLLLDRLYKTCKEGYDRFGSLSNQKEDN